MDPLTRTERTRRAGADERGGIYVEFLFAFMPIFMLFLAVCQLSLLASADLIVKHAAFSAARSAIVVLPADPQDFGGAPRHSLSGGRARTSDTLEGFMATVLPLAPPTSMGGRSGWASAAMGALGGVMSGQGSGPNGARMAPIRTSAYVPLLALAPDPASVTSSEGGSVGRSLLTGFQNDMYFAMEFTKAAAVVTVHSGPGVEAPVTGTIGSKDPVTVRVTYVTHCAVPLVRSMLCSSMDSLTGGSLPGRFGALLGGGNSAVSRRLQHGESPGALKAMVSGRAYFRVLSAEVTLPNQGADYESAEGEDES